MITILLPPKKKQKSTQELLFEIDDALKRLDVEKQKVVDNLDVNHRKGKH